MQRGEDNCHNSHKKDMLPNEEEVEAVTNIINLRTQNSEGSPLQSGTNEISKRLSERAYVYFQAMVKAV